MMLQEGPYAAQSWPDCQVRGFPATWSSDCPGEDFERSRAVKAIQGNWINLDCEGERYVVTGQHVTRTDTQGSRQFTLRWDPRRRQLQWGTQGRLYLTCLSDGLITWVPSRHNSRSWRWQRVGGVSLMSSEPLLPSQPMWAPPCRSLDSPPGRNNSGPLRVVDSGVGNYGSYGSGYNGSYGSGYSSDYGSYGNYGSYGAGYGPWRRHYSGNVGGRGWMPPYSGSLLQNHEGHGGRGFHRGPRGGAGLSGERLDCGLSNSEVYDLLFREITPEDYETLLRLDEKVSRPTVAPSIIDSLPTMLGKKLCGESCSVCLAAFEEEDVAATLPCRHSFHRACIGKWLSECRCACPLCGEDVMGDTAMSDDSTSGSTSGQRGQLQQGQHLPRHDGEEGLQNRRKAARTCAQRVLAAS
eukprot:CAMPEP_0115144170 /NCGR_PEP_ID=MMETSP0227-20121206/61270_1 /TAXON_ID=89957 /ORGANISM="Polarella glacialis, Strain CCMP 1383" /LENGTH=409 /DNA_ID=CAMNT_0002553265 /DNA_START=153 /DNA_END=1383 /DNA_ORIENTATION=-